MSATVKDQGAKRILIVENDESLLSVFEDLFGYEGFDVQSHAETDDIFALVEAYRPDLVLLDYMLPGINGGELCAQLKREVSTQNIPVVICSAYAPVILSLGSYGCNAFVSKPFEMKDLLAKVKECIADPTKIFEMEQKKKVFPI